MNLLILYFYFIRLNFEEVIEKHNARHEDREPKLEQKQVIVVEPHVIPSRGPYLYNEPKRYVLLEKQ